jgi:DNA-binding phage protein
MPKRRFKPFDTSAFLDDDEVIAEYLTAALEDRDLASIAARSGLGRESLYKALAPGAKPRYDTVLKVLQCLRVKVVLKAA